jgi:hypothetical protein
MIEKYEFAYRVNERSAIFNKYCFKLMDAVYRCLNHLEIPKFDIILIKIINIRYNFFKPDLFPSYLYEF